MLVWLWRRPAATALVLPLAWELPYATGADQKRQKKKKKAIHWEEAGGEGNSVEKETYYLLEPTMWQVQ